jgi:methylated-DNA-protein-cysteine methyltransferase-like protein
MKEVHTMLSFTERAITIIKNIPTGKVMTYGQIARLAGSPRGARQVVRILHSMSAKHQLPWHRVINAKGEIGFRDNESFITQKQFLEDEGIVLKKDNTIDLKTHQFYPVDVDDTWL